MSAPKYVFKIVDSKPDLNSPKIALSDLDKQSGFIHLSTGPQIPNTCNLFFSSVESLYILKFAYDKLQANMKWEPAPGVDTLFPHLYGDLLTADMDSVQEFQKGEASWVDVLGKDVWLFDDLEDN